MIAADSSVTVPAALRSHEAHAAAAVAIPADAALIAQVAMETYSVLTRLPRERRITSGNALEFLSRSFRLPPLPLSAGGYGRLLELAASNAIVGGAVYDAVVAATALEHGATLLTLDRRAERVYRLVGVDYRFVE